MQHVAVDREELARLRQLVDRAVQRPLETVDQLWRHLNSMEVLKLTAAVDREIQQGNLTVTFKEK